MSNAFERLVGMNGPIDMGDVEMLGDPAMYVPEVDRPAKYTEGKYTIQDRIDLGFAQNPTVIQAGQQAVFTAACSSPFKPERFMIDSAIAADVSVMSVDIGSARYVEGGPVPGSQYSEVSVANRVSWRTVQTTVPITVTIRNDSGNPVSVKMGVRGFRLVGGM
jgi:hypothetical protein